MSTKFNIQPIAERIGTKINRPVSIAGEQSQAIKGDSASYYIPQAA